MTCMLAPRRTATTVRRRTPPHVLAARSLLASYRRLVRAGEVLAGLDHGSERVASEATRAFIASTWLPASEAAGHAEEEFAEAMRSRGVAGVVVGGKLYVDLLACQLFDELATHGACNVLVVSLADLDLAGAR